MPNLLKIRDEGIPCNTVSARALEIERERGLIS